MKKHISVLLALVMLFSLASALPAMASTYIFTDTLVASTLVRASDSAEQSVSGETASASGEVLTGAVGDTLKVSGFVDMTVQEASGGGTILYLDVLNPFTADTVDSWVDIL